MRERVNSVSNLPLEPKRGRFGVPQRTALHLNCLDISGGLRLALFSASMFTIVIGCRTSLPAAPEPACPAPRITTSGWKETPGTAGSVFRMPDHFRKTSDIGIDVELVSWRATDQKITFWRGDDDPLTFVRSDPSLRGLTECREQVGGRSVRIVSYMVGDQYTASAFWAPVAPGTGLFFISESSHPPDQRVALTILRTVRFTFSPQ